MFFFLLIIFVIVFFWQANKFLSNLGSVFNKATTSYFDRRALTRPVEFSKQKALKDIKDAREAIHEVRGEGYNPDYWDHVQNEIEELTK